jgi:hypothetical protein
MFFSNKLGTGMAAEIYQRMSFRQAELGPKRGVGIGTP